MSEPIELMKVLLSLSLSGSLLILLLRLCRPLFRDRLSRRCQYYLWLVVVARLILPFAPETNLVGTLFSWYGPPVSAGTTPAVSVPASLPEENFSLPEPVAAPETGTAAPKTAPALGVPERDRWPSPEELAFAVWLLGALGLFAWKVIGYYRFLRQVRRGAREVSEPALLDLLAKAGAQIGVKKPVELYVNPAIFSPMMLGALRPCIVLPATDLPESELRCTLLHELTHYRRSDMLYKWLVQGAVCVHWFNPLVHWMAAEVSRACELSCDEAVIRRLDEQGRRDYGDTLLHAMEAGVSGLGPASLMLSENGSQLKERLCAIMKFHSYTRMTAVSSLAVLLALLVCAAATGAYISPDSRGPGQASTQVMEENGVYYLFVNGADESDKPTGGMAGGKVSFVLVRPDSYTTLSGFDSLDSLADQVAEQCGLMTAQGTISQEEAELVIGLARQLQTDGVSSPAPDISVPISIKGDPAYEHYYTQNGYYQDSWFFELGWNVREGAADSYDSVKLTLSDGTELTVLYNDVCRTWMQEQKTQAALAALLDRLRAERSDFPPVRPFVVNIEPANGKTPEELARQYAKAGNMPVFTAAFAMLDEAGQREWLDQFYQEMQVAYFAASLARLPEGSPLIEEFLEKACNDRQPALFSICLTELTDRDENSPLLERCAEQAYASGSINLFSILADYLDQGTLDRWLDRAKADGRSNFQAVILDTLGKDDELNEWKNEWKAERDRERVEEYRAHGITQTEDAYFYQGQRVRVFWDSRPDSSFVTLDYDNLGTVDVRVVRDENENIAAVRLMTAAEAEEIIRDLTEDDEDDDWDNWFDSDPTEGDEQEVTAQYDRIAAGEYVFLGTFYLKKGDQVRYHVTAESGQRMEVGFAKPGEDQPDVRYYSVTSGLEIITGAMTWKSPAESGAYRLFLHAEGADLTGVNGCIVITSAEE